MACIQRFKGDSVMPCRCGDVTPSRCGDVTPCRVRRHAPPCNGFLAAYGCAGKFMLVCTVCLSVIFEAQITGIETIQAILVPIPGSLVAGILSVWLSHSLRTAMPTSTWNWTWVSFAVSQLGCFVGMYALVVLDAIDGKWAWSSLLPSADFFADCFPFALQFWGISVTLKVFGRFVNNARARIQTKSLTPV